MAGLMTSPAIVFREMAGLMVNPLRVFTLGERLLPLFSAAGEGCGCRGAAAGAGAQDLPAVRRRR